MKKIVVVLEHRFYQFEGRLYTKLAFSYEYWKSYLTYFDEVEILARVQAIDHWDSSMRLVDGAGVSFIPMPYYRGIRGFVKNLPKLLATAWRVGRTRERFLLRSGNVTNIIWPILILLRRPYLREYPGNVREGIRGFAGDSILVRAISSISHGLALLQGKTSRANSYVSQYCREIYPSKRPGFVFSSFSLEEIGSSLASPNTDGNFVLVSVGRLEGEKGHSVLLRSLADPRLRGVTLNLVGDGGLLDELKKSVVGGSVKFHGAIADREKLFEIVRASHLFVIPSLTEGMPRALLEAMALGLPCIGSRVGGIPEILEDGCMFTPGNSLELSELIVELMRNSGLRNRVAQRNLSFVRENFNAQIVEQRKHAFWSKIYD